METTQIEPQLFSRRSESIPSSFIRDILKVANQREVISFAGGLPDPSLFPLRNLQDAARECFRLHGNAMLQYSKSEGLPQLKDWICCHYKTAYHMEITHEQLLITNGSQQALDLIGKALLNPGDQLILEQPSYLGAIQAFMAYEPEILPVPVLPDGVDLEALEALLLQHHPKFIYLVPNFQNPSGYTISLEKRKLLGKLAEKYKLLIVEDDPYGQLRFSGESLPPMRCFNSSTILCGSLSKIVAPGLRIGWVLANEEIIQKLLIFKQASDLHSNNLSQYIAAHFLQSQAYPDHLERVQQQYGEKSRLMYHKIREYFPEESIIRPSEGGMFHWVVLPEHMDAEKILQQCVLQKVLFVPGKFFNTNGKGQNTMRLNFTNSSPKEIDTGVAIIGRVLREIYS